MATYSESRTRLDLSTSFVATQQAQLIEAESKIIYLENEVSSLKQLLSENKVREKLSHGEGSEDRLGVIQTRCHKVNYRLVSFWSIASKLQYV